MLAVPYKISPPGARHKSGGWRVLTTSLEDARAAVERPCGPQVWAALLAELAAELHEVAPAGPGGDLPDGAELDDGGAAWVPRLGGRAPLSAELEQAARTGRWDRARYPGRSEARMAILTAAVARGWRLAEVQAAIADGAWRGLGALYERATEPGRLARLLPGPPGTTERSLAVADWELATRLIGRASPRRSGRHPAWRVDRRMN